MKQNALHPSSKLADLLHNRQVYQKHLEALAKASNNVQSHEPERIAQINKLRGSMRSTFWNCQTNRQKAISRENENLHRKIFSSSQVKSERGKSKDEVDQLQLLNQSADCEVQQQFQDCSPLRVTSRSFVLRNHRSSPVTKMTQLERIKQNLRLASQLIKSQSAICSHSIQAQSMENARRSQRIERYDGSALKAERYLQKKLSEANNKLPLTKRRQLTAKNNSFKLNNPEADQNHIPGVAFVKNLAIQAGLC